MSEGLPPREVAPKEPLANAVRDIFERRATHGDRKLILETYQQKFEHLVTHLPKEKQGTAMVSIQRFMNKIGGYVSEYGARLTDYVRKVVVWPMMMATENYPKDKYYQMELARANAWGEFADNTTKTATAERISFRDHFLPSAIIGAETIAPIGAIAGLTLLGASKGAAYGLVAGGAAGAVAGGIIGGGIAAGMYLSDKLFGPPVTYYNLFAGGGTVNVNLPSNITKGAASVAA